MVRVEGGGRAHPPKRLVHVACAQVSRDPPPALPGGYKVGDKMFYTGKNQTFDSGLKLTHGQQGEVMGPGTGKEATTHVAVLYPGNKGCIECGMSSVRFLRRHLPYAHTMRMPQSVLPLAVTPASLP